jgi:hypothetical protein
LIDLIFPGANELLFDSSSKAPQQLPSSQKKKSFSYYENSQVPNEVLGMISKHRELLMFSKPV